MHQPHFLLSAAARSLSLREAFALTDEQAFALFGEVRWGHDADPVCPSCGVAEQHWFLASRQQWRCRACGHTFSVTSGTLFAAHKLPLQVYLAAIAIYTNAVKGLSALQLARDLDVQYKTAFVLMHKLRASLLVHRDETPLAGAVQMDGCYTGGSLKPANRAEARVDRRLAEHRNPDRRCILVMRETFPGDDLAQRIGGKRTLGFRTKIRPMSGPWPRVSLRQGRRFLPMSPMPMICGTAAIRCAGSITARSTGPAMGPRSTRASPISHASGAWKSGSTTILVRPTCPTTPMKWPIGRIPGASPTAPSFATSSPSAPTPARSGLGAGTGSSATSTAPSAWRPEPLTRAPSPADHRAASRSGRRP